MVKKRTIWPYLLVAPAVLIILCVVFIPVFNAIVMSFQKYDLRRPKDIAFNGVANYMKAFGDPLFWNALWRTVIWVAAGVGLQFLFGLIRITINAILFVLIIILFHLFTYLTVYCLIAFFIVAEVDC